MCLQEFVEIKPNSSTPMQALPQTSNNLWICCSLNLRILDYSCTPSNSSLKSSMLRPVTNPLWLQEWLERPPRPLDVEWDYSLHFGTLIKPNQFRWENQLTIPHKHPRKSMWLNIQSDSKKKCLILKNAWTMSFWDLKRIDANDPITWELWGGEFI